jgi:hypothetical protein
MGKVVSVKSVSKLRSASGIGDAAVTALKILTAMTREDASVLRTGDAA